MMKKQILCNNIFHFNLINHFKSKLIMMKKVHLLLAFVLLTSFAFSQTGLVKGKIIDKSLEEALWGATVMLEGTTTGVITDEDGNYILENLPAGNFTVVASYVGYSPIKKEVTISEGSESMVNFELNADLVGLDQVVVTGVINPKSALESSVSLTTLNSKSIEQVGAVTTAEIFKVIPGIRSESSGGEGNANIAVRGIPIASGGSKYLQLHEDGLPVLQFGDISFGNADIFLRNDANIARVEAIKGGSASTMASNSPAGIINFISKTGAREGGSIGTTFGLNFKSLRTDFEYGSPIGNGVRFHLGGFFREGEGPRNTGYTGNYGGQIKANLTKEFKNGYARVYFKYLNDRTTSYMPMPVQATGTASNPSYSSIEGFDLLHGALQSPNFLLINSVDGAGNSRTTNMSDGMHPVSTSVGGEFSFDLDGGWKIDNKFRMAFSKGTFNSPFPAQIGSADAIATDIAGENYSLSYANGEKAGTVLSQDQIANLNNNGLLMRIITFDVEMNNLNNFTNDFHITKSLGKVSLSFGYYKAYQKIAMTWLWQTYLTDVSSDNGPGLMNISSADGTELSENGLIAHGVPLWGNCCTRGYDMAYTIDAPYAAAEIEITPNLTADASFRYDFGNATGYYLNNQQAEIDVNNNGEISEVEKSVTTLDNSNPNVVNYDFKYASYSIGANYKLADNKAVFARYSKGGRANADRLLYSSFLTPSGQTIDGLEADDIKQAELGFKYNSPIVGFYVTGFYSSISEQNEEFTKVIYKDFNSYGAELEAVAQLSSLNIAAGATFTKSEITKSLNEDEIGNTPRRVPSLMYNLSPSYTFLNSKAAIGLTLIGTTKVYAQDDNNVILPGYMYINAFASYSIIKGLVVSLHSNNLTNTLGFTEMEGDAFVDNQVNYLRARPITGNATVLSLKYNF